MTKVNFFVETFLLSDRDDDCELTVRCNGKYFYLRYSLAQFHESPEAKAYYFRCLEVLRSGEEVVDDLFDDEAMAWLAKPFEALIADHAPMPPGGLGTPTLAKYYFPEHFVLTVDVEREEFFPRRIETRRGLRVSGAWGGEEIVEDLIGWTLVNSPDQIVIHYERPKDVLNRLPGKVCRGEDTFFFKPFDGGSGEARVNSELRNFKNIVMTDLGSETRICRLHGVVGEGRHLLGMLLTFIDERLPLDRAKLSASPSEKGRWAAQIKAFLSALHRNGLVWGDVKPHNVLIDTGGNAWLVDFGGSYTEGWVDKDEVGTLKEDLLGLDRILEVLS